MSSINEAIFRGRMRRNDPPPTFDALNRSPIPLTSQFLARKAVEAVLAGGYTKCDPEPEAEEIETQVPAASERSKLVRDAVLWACILALAGVIGLTATSLLPSHAVQARAAVRRETLSTAVSAKAAQEASAEPARPAAETEAPRPQVVASATIQLKPVETPQPAETPMQRVRLTMPVAPATAAAPPVTTAALVTRSVVHPVSRPAGLIAATPDDQPVRVATSARPAMAPGAATARTPLAVEEVLYEGEPAAAADKTVAMTTRQHDDENGAERQEKADAAESDGKPRVEGIFYDKVRPMALINGKIVEAGKQVGEYTVSAIQPGMVVLARGGERIELHP
jgi:hypothetical protein